MWGKNNALYIVEDGASSVDDMACIRVAKDNRLTTLLKASESTLVQRMRAIDFSLDENTMYIANDNNASGTMGFGTMTKNGDKYENLTSLWDQGGITTVKVHPETGAVLSVIIPVHGYISMMVQILFLSFSFPMLLVLLRVKETLMRLHLISREQPHILFHVKSCDIQSKL